MGCSIGEFGVGHGDDFAGELFRRLVCEVYLCTKLTPSCHIITCSHSQRRADPPISKQTVSRLFLCSPQDQDMWLIPTRHSGYLAASFLALRSELHPSA